MCDACGGGDETQALDDNIIYALSKLSIVLIAQHHKLRYEHLRQPEEMAHFAQPIGIENKTERTLVHEVVASVADSDMRKETCTLITCKLNGT